MSSTLYWEGATSFVLDTVLFVNRGQAELSTDSSERSTVEHALFSQGPWSVIGKDCVGVLALKGRLEELLVEITRPEFPKVKLQIDRQLASRRENIAALGTDLHLPEEQGI
jgi:hypothetical protein